MPPLPSKMRQVIFDGAGGPEVVKLAQADVPTPGAGKVLVEVAAFGINRPDCAQRAGAYPPPPGETQVPGLEIAGRIVAVGPDVTGLKVGDEICALVGSGGYAEYALADAALCLLEVEDDIPPRSAFRIDPSRATIDMPRIMDAIRVGNEDRARRRSVAAAVQVE